MESGERALVVVVRDATAGDAGLQATEAARRATGVALGAAELALQILRAILDRSGPSRPDAHAPRSSELPDALHQLPGAALGLGLELQRRSLDVAAALGATLWPSLRVVAGPVVTVAGVPLGAAWRRLHIQDWAARGLAEQRRNRQAAIAATRALVGAMTAAVLDEVDLDDVVARVDLDRIVDRLDLDQIAERIDVDAIAARVDLPGIAERVLNEVDIGGIIRESSSTMATETVDTLRVQGIRADRFLSRTVDRVLGRREERQTDAWTNSPPLDEARSAHTAP